MHLFCTQLSPDERLHQEEFAKGILTVREGRYTNNEIVQWPINGIIPDNTSRSLANAIYPTLADPNAPLPTAQHLVECAILTTRNDTIDKLNEQLFAFMNDEVFILYNIDKMMNEKNVKSYMIEYLNTINLSNLSSHELKLKIDAIVILLRNLNSFIELCNKTHLHVTRINQ